MTKWTPGPWTIDPKVEAHVIAGERAICSISFSDSRLADRGREENSANARLIAAAPDLYEALDEALNRHVAEFEGMDPQLRAGFVNQEWFQRLNDVLVRARGEADG